MSGESGSGGEQTVWLCGRCGGVRNVGAPSVKIDGERFDPGCVPKGVKTDAE